MLHTAEYRLLFTTLIAFAWSVLVKTFITNSTHVCARKYVINIIFKSAVLTSLSQFVTQPVPMSDQGSQSKIRDLKMEVYLQWVHIGTARNELTDQAAK